MTIVLITCFHSSALLRASKAQSKQTDILEIINLRIIKIWVGRCLDVDWLARCKSSYPSYWSKVTSEEVLFHHDFSERHGELELLTLEIEKEKWIHVVHCINWCISIFSWIFDLNLLFHCFASVLLILISVFENSLHSRLELKTYFLRHVAFPKSSWAFLI